MTRRIKLAGVMAGVLAAAVGCSGDGWSLRSTERETDPRFAELRRRMALTFVRTRAGGVETVTEEADVFAEVVLERHCNVPTSCPTAAAAADCSPHRACAAAYVCVANAAMRILQAPSATQYEIWVDDVKEDYNVPPQDQATNAALAEIAAEYASSASVHADLGITSCNLATSLDELAHPPAPMLIGGELAATWVEAFNIRLEAATELERAALAVADGAYAGTSNIADAAALSLTAPYVSRSHTAHGLVGGEDGLQGLGAEVDANGFCPDQRLSAEAARALELIRQAGPPPGVVRIRPEGSMPATVPLDTLITGWVMGDSLRYRWSVLMEDTSIATLSPSAIYRRFGVTEQAFIDARAYLSHELAMSDRDPEVILPGDSLGSGETTDLLFDLYAATRVPPTRPIALYSAVVASYRSEPANVSVEAFWTAPAPVPVPSASGYGFAANDTYFYDASSVAAITNTAHYLEASLARMTAQIGVVDSVDSAGGDLLASHVGALRGTAPGWMQVCTFIPKDSMNHRDSAILDVRLSRIVDDKNLRVVVGRSGLECAVRGAVEGAACDLDDYAVAPAAGRPWEVVGSAYMRAGFAVTDIAPSAAVPEAVQIFVVEGPENGDAGEYRPLSGAMVRITTSATSTDLFQFEPANTDRYQHCDLSVIAPELVDRAAEAIGADPSYCGRPRAHCAGSPELIPLENELTSDGDSVESSWRHYLGIARNAADEADRLGEEVIRTGLEMDLRAESAVDELETICGVSINVNPVSAPPAATSGTCSGAACPTGYTCSAGTCVFDPIAYAVSLVSDADSQRLAECLGGDTEVPFAALGNRHLCFWTIGDDPSTLCQGAGENGVRECPWAAPVDIDPTTGEAVVPAASVCAAADNVPTNPMIEFAVTDRLGLFPMPNPEEPGADAGTTNEITLPCMAFARARAALPIDGEAPNTSAFFDLSNFALYASQLGWRAQAGDVSHVTWNGTSVVSTGSTTGSASMEWPFSSDRMVGMARLCPSELSLLNTPNAPDVRTPLSCIGDVTWGNRLVRAQVNDMLARAVMAARLVAGVGLGEVRVPFYPTAVDGGLTFGAAPSTASGPPVEGWEAGIPRSMSYVFQRATQGAVIVHGSEFEDYGRFNRTLMDFGAIAERITPNSGSCVTNPLSVEWTNCPYDRTECLETFDDGPDADDACGGAELGEWDRDMPMLVRRLPSLDGNDPQTYVTRLWGRERGAAMRALIAEPSRLEADFRFLDSSDGFEPAGSLTDLTRYFRRSSCGDGSCDELSRIVSCGMEGPNCEDVGCRGNNHDNYYGCDALGEREGVDFPSIRDGNRAFIGINGISRRDVLNGVELLCYGALTASPSVDPLTAVCGADPPEVSRLGDLVRVERFLTCQGNAIRSMGANSIVAGLPRRVVELVQRGPPRVAGEGAGEFAAAASEIAASYTALRDAEVNISLTAETLATEIELLNNAIEVSDYTDQLDDLSLQSQIFDRVTSCAVAAANAVGAAGAKFDMSLTGALAAMTVTCANTGVQIGLAQRMRDVRGAIEEINTESAFLRFDARVNELTATMTREANAINAALLRIDAALSRLEGLQMRGRRALSRALGMGTDVMGAHMAVDTVNHARYNTALTRYRESQVRAVRLAYIARVALEQRLGMTLDSMEEDLVTVEAPAGWADDICNLPVINYDEIRNSDVGPTGERMADSSPFLAPDGYSGAYVGDYVRRLEQVFESYNFAYPFQDGTDEVVLSLRDDIHGLRERCALPGPNLLYQAGHLDRFAGTTVPGWEAEACAALPPTCNTSSTSTCWPAGSLPRPPNCISASPIDGDPGPIDVVAERTGHVPGYRLIFGSPSVNRDLVAPAGDESYSGTTAATRFIQYVSVGPGIHRLSLYTRTTAVGAVPDAYRIDAANAMSPDFGSFLRVVQYFELLDENGEVIGTDEDDLALIQHRITSETLPGGWVRHQAFVDVPSDAVVGVIIDPNFEAVSGTRYSVLDVTGVMLEDVSTSVGGDITSMVAADHEPGPFFDTTEVLTRMQPGCEDTDGSLFRDRSFNYGCVRVCPDGYDGRCIAAESESRCFWETSFSANSDVLERLTGRTSAGFAAGSYNYRIERLALNLVGTNLRDCEGVGAGTPSTCYAAGTTAYSLSHSGPFLVRNARGELYSAPLFTGRIENADALAMERYLTNPLSSVDRSIVDAESALEFRGRPLGGTIVLRIWDDAAFRFDRLEDVQIVLGYRYWTRQR